MEHNLARTSERRHRLRVLIAAGLFAACLLAVYGYRTAVAVSVAAAESRGVLAPHQAEIVQVAYAGGGGGYSSAKSTQSVTLWLDTGAEVTLSSQRHLDLRDRTRVTVGMWRSVPVTVDGVDVYKPWTPGWCLGFIFLPPAFVLAVFQGHRLRQMRRGRTGRQILWGASSYDSTAAAAALALFCGFAMALVPDVAWASIPALATATLGPLTWFVLQDRYSLTMTRNR